MNFWKHVKIYINMYFFFSFTWNYGFKHWLIIGKKKSWIHTDFYFSFSRWFDPLINNNKDSFNNLNTSYQLIINLLSRDRMRLNSPSDHRRISSTCFTARLRNCYFHFWRDADKDSNQYNCALYGLSSRDE